MVIVWDDDDISNPYYYIRVFHSFGDNGSVNAYQGANTDNIFKRTQNWTDCKPYTQLKQATPVVVTYEIEGQKGNEQCIRLLVKNESDVEKYSKMQGLIESSYIYEGELDIDYRLYNKNNFKFD